jgi:hypothetical protein
MAELDVIQGELVTGTDRAPETMTDREILMEILLQQRMPRDLITGLVKDIMGGPFGAMLAGGQTPFQAMFSRNRNG